MDTLDRGNAAVLRGHFVGLLSTKEAYGACLGFSKYDSKLSHLGPNNGRAVERQENLAFQYAVPTIYCTK